MANRLAAPGRNWPSDGGLGKRTHSNPSARPAHTETASTAAPTAATTAGTAITLIRQTGSESIRSIVPRPISPLIESDPRPTAQPTHTKIVTDVREEDAELSGGRGQLRQRHAEHRLHEVGQQVQQAAPFAHVEKAHQPHEQPAEEESAGRSKPASVSQASDTAFFHRARFMLRPSIATHGGSGKAACLRTGWQLGIIG